MYKIVKQDKSKKVFETSVKNDDELIQHLNAVFHFNNHKIIAVINLEEDQTCYIVKKN